MQSQAAHLPQLKPDFMCSTFRKWSKTLVFLLLMLVINAIGYAWTNVGHKLVAQIAYDNLNPDAKIMCAKLMRVDINHLNTRFVSSSIWLDVIRKKNNHRFDKLHYIDIPFSSDKSKLPPISKINALTAIRQAESILTSPKASMAQKALNLRILIHVLGDIHQPLHTSTQVTKAYPEGDQGGNLFPLSRSPVGSNLHRLWDNGGGLFLGKSTKKSIAEKAREFESSWPCTIANHQAKTEEWVNSSHQLALTQAYTILPGTKPTQAYQKNAQALSEQQIAFAGCRLALMLNRIAQQAKRI